MNPYSDFHNNFKKLEEFVIVLAIIFSGFVSMAVFKIVNFLTFPSLDEMLWHFRSRFFWDRILNLDFSNLIQSAQPGITVYWFTGFMMKFIDYDFNSIQTFIQSKEKESGMDFNYINSNDPLLYKTYETISFAFNFPLVILTILFFIAFYYLLKKLGFNRAVASFALIFLVTNVFISNWITPSDKMLNIFFTLSFLTFLVYINKTSDRKYFIASAILGAWAVLSKLSALFILPFYFLVLLAYSWPLNKNKIGSILKDYSLWIIIFTLIFVIFLPTALTDPGKIYDLVFKPEYVYEKDFSSSTYLARVAEYLKYFIFNLGSEMYIGGFMFALTFFIFASTRKFRRSLQGIPKKNSFSIIAFILFFSTMVILASQNHDIRFMSPAFVLLAVVSAAGLYGFVNLAIEKFGYSPKYAYPLAGFVMIVSQYIAILSNSNLMDEVKKYFG